MEISTSRKCAEERTWSVGSVNLNLSMHGSMMHSLMLYCNAVIQRC